MNFQHLFDFVIPKWLQNDQSKALFVSNFRDFLIKHQLEGDELNYFERLEYCEEDLNEQELVYSGDLRTRLLSNFVETFEVEYKLKKNREVELDYLETDLIRSLLFYSRLLS